MNDKDPSLATILELIFGYFALPGVGWIYAGEVGTGIMILGGYWAMMIAVSIALFALTFLTLGCGSILFVLLVPLHLATPIVSSMKLNRYLTGQAVQAAYAAAPRERMDRIFEPARPVVVQQIGMSGGQVMILILLTVMACIVSCGVLMALGIIAAPPPPGGF